MSTTMRLPDVLRWGSGAAEAVAGELAAVSLAGSGASLVDFTGLSLAASAAFVTGALGVSLGALCDAGSAPESSALSATAAGASSALSVVGASTFSDVSCALESLWPPAASASLAATSSGNSSRCRISIILAIEPSGLAMPGRLRYMGSSASAASGTDVRPSPASWPRRGALALPPINEASETGCPSAPASACPVGPCAPP